VKAAMTMVAEHQRDDNDEAYSQSVQRLSSRANGQRLNSRANGQRLSSRAIMVQRVAAR
jgi:hypothetical protein